MLFVGHIQGVVLRTFDVFRNSRGTLKCAKRGWCWPAFFFAPFWALFCGLWLMAIVLFPVEIALNAVGGALSNMQASGMPADTAIVVVYLLVAVGIRVFFGARGNALKRRKWQNSGFSLVFSADAESADSAVMMAKTAQRNTATPVDPALAGHPGLATKNVECTETAAATPVAPAPGGNAMVDDMIRQARQRLQRELLQIESRTDLTPDQKIDRVITIFSTVCAAIAIQPIPFADFFILTPLQAFMGARLSAIRGVPITEAESSDLVKEIMGVVGMGLLAQQVGIAAAKVFFPVVGGIATIPVVFGLTYAIGKVMDFYLVGKAAGRTPSASELKAAWKDAKAKGEAEGKVRQTEIERGQGNREAPHSEPRSSDAQTNSEPVLDAQTGAPNANSHFATDAKVAGSAHEHGNSQPNVLVDEPPVATRLSRTVEARIVEDTTRHADVTEALKSRGGESVPISEGLDQIAFKIANELVGVIRTEDALWWFVMEQFNRLHSSKHAAKLMEAFPLQLREVEYQWGKFEPFIFRPENPGLAYLSAQVEPALAERFGQDLAELTVAHAFLQYCVHYVAVIQPVRRKYAAHFRDELRSRGHLPLADRWDEVLKSLDR